MFFFFFKFDVDLSYGYEKISMKHYGLVNLTVMIIEMLKYVNFHDGF